MSALSPRHFQVLHAVVQNYIDTGEPVASRSIARKYPMSPASIRNMMADLLEAGYLSQPHTSAGRVPTGMAYESYVKTLFSSRIVQAELDRLHLEIQEAGSVEARIERSSKLLTEITRNFGIAAAIPTNLRSSENSVPAPIRSLAGQMNSFGRTRDQESVAATDVARQIPPQTQNPRVR